MFSEVGAAKGWLRVHLRDEDHYPASGEVLDIRDRRLTFFGTHATLQPLHVLEVPLEDAMVGRLAPVWRSDDSGGLVPLKVGILSTNGMWILA